MKISLVSQQWQALCLVKTHVIINLSSHAICTCYLLLTETYALAITKAVLLVIQGNTAVMIAARKGHTDVIMHLLHCGADKDARNFEVSYCSLKSEHPLLHSLHHLSENENARDDMRSCISAANKASQNSKHCCQTDIMDSTGLQCAASFMLASKTMSRQSMDD